MEKNELIELEITALTSEGSGIGRSGGMAVFVPFTAPGDRAQVRIVKVQKSLCFGIVEQLLSPGPGRTAPDCAVFGRCGGCDLRHLTYDCELAAKRQFVQDAFDRIGGFALQAAACLPSPQRDRYRNKVQYPLAVDGQGRVFAGFFAPRSHRVVACDDCLLQPQLLNRIAAFLCGLFTEFGLPVYDEQTQKGLLRHLYLRHAARTGEVLVCIVAARDHLPREAELTSRLTSQFPEVKSVVLNCNPRSTNVILGARERVLCGTGRLADTLCGVPVELSPASFYQVNTAGAEQLYGVAKALAAPRADDVLLDLYCGAGTIGLSMAGEVAQLIGVEIVSPAIESARRAAQQMGVPARFLCADAGQAAQQLAAEGLHPSLIVLDPPRKGCDEAALAAVAAMAPQRVVMVSCNPATAARDARFLAAHGYRPTALQPVDLFARTKHVESVCRLEHV